MDPQKPGEILPGSNFSSLWPPLWAFGGLTRIVERIGPISSEYRLVSFLKVWLSSMAGIVEAWLSRQILIFSALRNFILQEYYFLTNVVGVWVWLKYISDCAPTNLFLKNHYIALVFNFLQLLNLCSMISLRCGGDYTVEANWLEMELSRRYRNTTTLNGYHKIDVQMAITTLTSAEFYFIFKVKMHREMKIFHETKC